MSARFVKNPGFEAELQAEPGFQAAMRQAARDVADEVRAIAPKHTGYYARRIRVRGTTVRAEDAFWHLIEYGSKNNPAYAPLRRGVRAAGLRFDDPRK